MTSAAEDPRAVVVAPSPRGAPARGPAPDVMIGAAALTVAAASSVARRTGAAVAPVLRWTGRPPLVPERWAPARAGEAVARELGQAGAAVRQHLVAELSRRLDVLVPLLVEELARRVDLTALVLRHVDVDAVVARADLDAAAARLDVDAVVARADLDAAAARLDVDAVVARADLDSAAARLDVDALLDRLDLTGLVLERVDLATVVAAALDRVDLDQLVALAGTVVDAIDLPDIIRGSSGAMATDTVRGARMRGIAADDAISRARDRLLGHR